MVTNVPTKGTGEESRVISLPCASSGISGSSGCWTTTAGSSSCTRHTRPNGPTGRNAGAEPELPGGRAYSSIRGFPKGHEGPERAEGQQEIHSRSGVAHAKIPAVEVSGFNSRLRDFGQVSRYLHLVRCSPLKELEGKWGTQASKGSDCERLMCTILDRNPGDRERREVGPHPARGGQRWLPETMPKPRLRRE